MIRDLMTVLSLIAVWIVAVVVYLFVAPAIFLLARFTRMFKAFYDKE